MPLIKGQGTETSDSIPMTVDKGAYILPADTTRDIMVSDNEFAIPPEAMAAIGTQFLDLLRHQTSDTVKKARKDRLNDGVHFVGGGVVGLSPNGLPAQAYSYFDQLRQRATAPVNIKLGNGFGANLLRNYGGKLVTKAVPFVSYVQPIADTAADAMEVYSSDMPTINKIGWTAQAIPRVIGSVAAGIPTKGLGAPIVNETMKAAQNAASGGDMAQAAREMNTYEKQIQENDAKFEAWKQRQAQQPRQQVQNDSRAAELARRQNISLDEAKKRISVSNNIAGNPFDKSPGGFVGGGNTDKEPWENLLTPEEQLTRNQGGGLGASAVSGVSPTAALRDAGNSVVNGIENGRQAAIGKVTNGIQNVADANSRYKEDFAPVVNGVKGLYDGAKGFVTDTLDYIQPTAQPDMVQPYQAQQKLDELGQLGVNSYRQLSTQALAQPNQPNQPNQPTTVTEKPRTANQRYYDMLEGMAENGFAGSRNRFAVASRDENGVPTFDNNSIRYAAEISDGGYDPDRDTSTYNHQEMMDGLAARQQGALSQRLNDVQATERANGAIVGLPSGVIGTDPDVLNAQRTRERQKNDLMWIIQHRNNYKASQVKAATDALNQMEAGDASRYNSDNQARSAMGVAGLQADASRDVARINGDATVNSTLQTALTRGANNLKDERLVQLSLQLQQAQANGAPPEQIKALEDNILALNGKFKPNQNNTVTLTNDMGGQQLFDKNGTQLSAPPALASGLNALYNSKDYSKMSKNDRFDAIVRQFQNAYGGINADPSRYKQLLLAEIRRQGLGADQ